MKEQSDDRPGRAGRHIGTHGGQSDGAARFLSGPGLHEFPVGYAVVDGVAVYHGCIEMGPADEVAHETTEIAERHRLRAATRQAGVEPSSALDLEHLGIGLPGDDRFLWTGARVAYSVDPGVPDQRRVDDAIAHIEQNTGIRFERRTAANSSRLPNWIEIISNRDAGWSSSAIGMRGERQLIRLSDRHAWPILVHEFMHALGVYHEQSRSDRDEFVEVSWTNIQDGPPPEGETDARHNFQKQPGSTDYFDYDYGSLMHYGPRSFAKDRSLPTLLPRRPGVTIGQREGLSFGDRQTVAKMYERLSTKGYSGVWRAGIGAYGLWANAAWEDFRSTWQTWSGQGLRLVDLHVRQTRDGPRYSGVFLPGTGAHALWVNATWEGFRSKWQELSGQGLRLHDLHVHSVNGQDRYSGVFLPGTGRHGLWVGATWESFVEKWADWARQGLRLVDLNQHHVGGENRFAGVFLPGSDRHVLWGNVTWESFRAKWEELAGQGLRLVDFEFVNPPAGALLDGGDLSAGDLALTDVGPEPFGGLLEAAATLPPGALPRQGEGRADRADVCAPSDDGQGMLLAADEAGDDRGAGLPGGPAVSGAAASTGVGGAFHDPADSSDRGLAGQGGAHIG